MKVFKSRIFIERGLISAFFYVCFIFLIGYSSFFQGLSYYYADFAFRSGSIIDAETAVAFQPKNPDAYKTVGDILLRNKNYPAATAAFEQAISLRENDFLLWLRLGSSRYESGDIDDAAAAYSKALSLARNYSQPYYYYGKMYLEIGRPEQAFSYLSKAAERNVGFYPEVLHLARISYPNDPAAIQNAAPPETPEAKKIFAGYFIKHSFMTPELEAYLISDELTEAEKNAVIWYLIKKHNFHFAHEVWVSTIPELERKSLIFDGGFESITRSDDSGFGWRIDQNASDTSVARVDKGAHSGSYALEIKFAGNVEMNRKIVSQLAYLKAHTKYRLTFSYRSEELVSVGLPIIEISDGKSNKTLGRPAVLQPTNGHWMDLYIDFVTEEPPAACISLQRIKCDTSPCPIFGEIYLDDFSMRER